MKQLSSSLEKHLLFSSGLSPTGQPLWRRLFAWLGVGLLLGALGLPGCEERSAPPLSGGVGWQSRAIIGGTPDVRHPAVGALTSGGHIFCTATLIGPRLLLTAAHCLDAAVSLSAQNQKVSFRVDYPQPDGTTFPTFFDVTKMISHPKWLGSKRVLDNDIGVAVLSQEVPNVRPIWFNQIPLDQTWKKKSPLFLGYGLLKTHPDPVSPGRKYGATIPIVWLGRDRLTTYAGSRSICHGDSGGPALHLVRGRLRVIGVNSYISSPSKGGRSTCTGSGTSFRTDYFADFLHKHLAKYGPPTTCEKDENCGDCDQCKGKKCDPIPLTAAPQTCQPCRRDADCGTTGRCLRLDNVGYRCVQPCDDRSCCPSGSTCGQTPRLNGDFCLPTKCPDVSCTDAAKDCGPGELCQGGVCRPDRPAPAPTLCHPCTSHKECKGEGSLCLGAGGARFCSQPCGKEDFCPEGFVCQSPYPGIRQCLPRQGTFCAPRCQRHEDCPSPAQSCSSKGYCARKGGGLAGEPCDSEHPCSVRYRCVATTWDGGRCLAPCGYDPGVAGSPCLRGSCQKGLLCHQLGTHRNVCLDTCSSGSSCSAGGNCSAATGLICRCETNADCDEGNSCNTTMFRTSGSCVKGEKKICAPTEICRAADYFTDGGSYCVPGESGLAGPGEGCDGFRRCQKGLSCEFTPAGSFCLENCTQPSCKYGGVCQNSTGGKRLCICTQNSQCLAGQECFSFFEETVGFCIPQAGRCRYNAHCPPQHRCLQGKCQPGTPDEETPAEKIPDEPDRPPEFPSEPVPQELSPPEQRPSDTSPSDGGKDDSSANDSPPPGCSCQIQPA